MTSCLRWVLVFSLLVFLIGCATHRFPYLNSDLTKETWGSTLTRSADRWSYGADPWFVSSGDNASEVTSRRAPNGAVMSTMKVSVPEFTGIKVIGDFQVQLFGTFEENSIFIHGPNDAVGHIEVLYQGKTVMLRQLKNAPAAVRGVTVRIGIKQLNYLEHVGTGRVEGIRLQSNGLFLNACANSNLYLAGDINVRRIIHAGNGNVNLFGVNTSAVDVQATGKGTLNISGRVGVRKIYESGCANINIIGADSSSLDINASGLGRIGIVGAVNLSSVNVSRRAQVYIDGVRSDTIYANLSGNAVVGLTGTTNHLNVNTCGSSCFLGKYLCASEAYVRASDRSHINVTAGTKIFASATQNSSIYFFGLPKLLSQFANESGTIVPVWSPEIRNCSVQCQRPMIDYKNERDYKGEQLQVMRHRPRFVPHHHRRVEKPVVTHYHSPNHSLKPVVRPAPNSGHRRETYYHEGEA